MLSIPIRLLAYFIRIFIIPLRFHFWSLHLPVWKPGLFLWLRNWQNYRWEWQYSLSCMLFWRWSFYLMKQAARENLLVPRLKPLQVLCTAWNSNSAITLLMHYKFFNQVCLFFCYLGVVCLSKFYDIICLHTAYSISFNRERNNK